MQEVTVTEREPQLKIALSGEIDSKNAEEFYEAVMTEYREIGRASCRERV